jgi:hypothetical protein
MELGDDVFIASSLEDGSLALYYPPLGFSHPVQYTPGETRWARERPPEPWASYMDEAFALTTFGDEWCYCLRHKERHRRGGGGG